MANFLDSAGQRLRDFMGGTKLPKIESIGDQPTDELKLISWIKNKLDEVRQSNSRVANEGIWLTNIAYLMGFDSVFFDTSLRQFRQVGRPYQSLKRNRIHINKILPSVQNRLSRLCKTPPKYEVKPNTSDNRDKEAARLGMQVIGMIWDKQKINQKRIDMAMWVQQAGHAYLQPCWDDQLGEMVPHPGNPNDFIYEGDIRIDVVSPFEVYPDPLATSIEDARWAIKAKVRPLEYFRSHYKERGHLVKGEDAWIMSAQYELRINSFTNQGNSQTPSQQVMKNSAIEIVYYERRSQKHPNGRQITMANGVLLEDKELPIGEIPLVKFDDVKVGGKFYPESVITHARPIQDQFNRTYTQIATWTNRLLAGKYVVPKGHGMAQESMNDQSGEIVEYNIQPNAPNAGEPRALQIPQIPSYAFEETERLQNQLYDIFGINEISRGQLPAAGIPAIGMQFLQEQDDTRIGIVTEQWEHGFADLGRMILKYVGGYYKTPRLLKVAGKNLAYTVKKFTGEDLRENYDVCVIRGSTLPGSKILKRQEILNAYNQGLLGDPADPAVREKVLGLLEYGDVAEMWEDYALDSAQIEKQIDMIKMGEVPPISELDNNQMHILVKNRLRKTDEFEMMTPASKAILEMDIEKRIEILTEMANPGGKEQIETLKAQKMNPALSMVQEGVGDVTLSDLDRLPTEPIDPKLANQVAVTQGEENL